MVEISCVIPTVSRAAKSNTYSRWPMFFYVLEVPPVWAMAALTNWITWTIFIHQSVAAFATVTVLRWLALSLGYGVLCFVGSIRKCLSKFPSCLFAWCLPALYQVSPKVWLGLENRSLCISFLSKNVYQPGKKERKQEEPRLERYANAVHWHMEGATEWNSHLKNT